MTLDESLDEQRLLQQNLVWNPNKIKESFPYVFSDNSRGLASAPQCFPPKSIPPVQCVALQTANWQRDPSYWATPAEQHFRASTYSTTADTWLAPPVTVNSLARDQNVSNWRTLVQPGLRVLRLSPPIKISNTFVAKVGGDIFCFHASVEITALHFSNLTFVFCLFNLVSKAIKNVDEDSFCVFSFKDAGSLRFIVTDNKPVLYY